jgi:hypothetical protein
LARYAVFAAWRERSPREHASGDRRPCRWRRDAGGFCCSDASLAHRWNGGCRDCLRGDRRNCPRGGRQGRLPGGRPNCMAGGRQVRLCDASLGHRCGGRSVHRHDGRRGGWHCWWPGRLGGRPAWSVWRAGKVRRWVFRSWARLYRGAAAGTLQMCGRSRRQLGRWPWHPRQAAALGVDLSLGSERSWSRPFSVAWSSDQARSCVIGCNCCAICSSGS